MQHTGPALSDEHPTPSRAPFPPWANSVMTWALWVLTVVLVGVPSLLMIWVRSPLHTLQYQRVEQPIAFDHRHHVRDDGISCEYCHYDVARSATAGIPDTELCMGCHGQIWTESPMLEPVRASFYRSEPVHWRRVNRLPDFVYFAHDVHVRKGIGCEVCHGRVDRMSNVYAATTLQMGWCLDCHRAPEKFLRSPNLVTVMGYEPVEPQSAIGARLKRDLSVNPPVYCSGCHR